MSQKIKALSFLVLPLSFLSVLVEKLFTNGCYLIGVARQKDIKISQLKQYYEDPKDKADFEEWQKFKHSYAPTASVSFTLLKFMIKRNWLKFLPLLMLTTVLKFMVFYRPIALGNLLSIGKESEVEESRGYRFILYYVGFELAYAVIQQVNSLIQY